MGDDLLHSMISNVGSSLHSLSSLDSLELLTSSQTTDMEMSSGYNSTTPPAMVVEEDQEDDRDSSSTGYLQDVLFEFTSKRRRLQLLFGDHDQQQNYSMNHHQFHHSNENYLASNFIQNYCENFDQMANPGQTISDNQEGISETYDSSSCNSQKDYSTADTQWTNHYDDHDNHHKTKLPIHPSDMKEKIKRKRVPPKVVYPFALVKPGGFEGDATLNDINERILMPPTRPVRHPVGDFACRPLVSPQGPGLSGKAVVTFTRVHTQGRGTITIIRTRG